MKRKTKQTSAHNTYGNTVVSRESVNDYFIKSAKPKDSQNDYAAKFISIMNAVQAAKPAFDIQDMYMFAGPYGIPNDVLKSLWEKWVDAMVMWGKCARTPSVYDSGDLILTVSM